MDYESKNRGPRRLAAIVAGGAAAVLSLGFAGTGGALLWADSKGDDQGYITTRTETFSTSTHALATENLDLELDGPESLLDDGELGTIRVKAESNDGKPVFVGIARTSEVSDYLRGSSHALVTDVEYSPFDADYSTRDGDRRPAAPAEQRFWAATAHGDGRQALEWEVDDGDWSVVVMNEDGSKGVDAGINAGVRIGWLDEAGWISLSTGLGLLALSAALVLVGVRRQRPDEPKPSAPRSVAGSSSTTSSSGTQ